MHTHKFFILSSFAFLHIPNLSYAQTPPDIGNVLKNQIAPVQQQPQRTNEGIAVTPEQPVLTSKAQDTVPITVHAIHVVGNTVFSEAQLQPLFAQVVDQTASLGQLQLVAARITNHYRKAGYLVATAYLSPQKIVDGVVTITILEGKLSDIKLENNSRLSNERTQATLSHIDRTKPLNRKSLDRAVLILGDTAGVGVVDSRLSSGNNIGETVLNVNAGSTAPFSGQLDADNYGGLYTGRTRLGGVFNLNSPTGLGEKLSARILTSDDGLVYGRLGGELPVNGDGLVLGASYDRTLYSLGDVYSALDAVGRADTTEATLRYPLIRSVDANLYTQASFDHRKLTDEIRSTSTTTDKHINASMFGAYGDLRDRLGGGGMMQGSIFFTTGQLHIDSLAASQLDAVGARSEGSYSKWVWDFDRQQSITQRLSLDAHWRGQWAGENLDSSEKFSLGGASGVRAYASGEATGDRGWIASLDLRYAILPNLSANVFHDVGEATVNAKPFLATKNDLHRSATGFGLNGNYHGFEGQAIVARRGHEIAESEPDKKYRLWVRLSRRF